MTDGERLGIINYGKGGNKKRLPPFMGAFTQLPISNITFFLLGRLAWLSMRQGEFVGVILNNKRRINNGLRI